MPAKPLFPSAYLAWLSLIWESLERVDRRALVATCADALQPCATQLQIVRLELLLQLRAVARLQARGLLDAECGGQVTLLVEDLQQLLPDACSSSVRVMRCVRAAQDRLFHEISTLDCSPGVVLRRRA